MGTAVPIPMNIKDRSTYQALVKIARSLQRSSVTDLVEFGSTPISDDLAISNTATLTLQETVQDFTGITYEDYHSDNNIWNFSATIKGDIGYTPGDTNLPSYYVDIRPGSPILGDTDNFVILEMDIYVRGITSIQNATLEWKVKKLS